MHWLLKLIDTGLSAETPLFASNNVIISLTFDRKSIDPSTRLNDFLFVAVLKFSTLVRRVFPKSNRVLLARGRHPLRAYVNDVTRGEQEVTLACNGVLEAQSTTDSEAE